MATVTPAYIDEEIDKHLLSLSNLRAQKNAFLPICRLPPEILANIFTHGARDYHENNGLSGFRIPGWVNVSYVCRHWRNVALDCPTLWTYHFTASLRWTEELLVRSKQASLRIRICCDSLTPGSWWSALLERLLSHAERIQELRLRVPTVVLPSKLILCGPRLEILDICVLWSNPFEWTSVIDDGDIPSLRTLQLTDCLLPWHSLNLTGLTTLFLCRVPAQSKQNIVEFLATLGRLQSLTVLHLEHALASAREVLSSRTSEVSPKTGLPCLARLLVAAPLSTALVLLSRVIFPSKAEVRVEFQSEDSSSAGDFAEIPSVLARRFRQSEDLSSLSPTIRSLVIRFPVYLEPTFTFCLSERGDCDPGLSMMYPPRDCNDSPVTLVAIDQGWMFGEMEHIISDICCSIPLIHVQTLHVIHPPPSLYFWEKTLGHLYGLKLLKLSDGTMPNLVPLLALAAEESVGTPRGTSDCAPTPGLTYTPALEELVLDRIKLTYGDNALTDVISEKSLLDAFSTRKAPRPRLTMIECGHVEDDYPDPESDIEDDDSPYPFGFYLSESSLDEYY